MPSFTGSLALVVCGAKLVFDAYFAYRVPAPVNAQDALWSAFHFVQALKTAQDNLNSCPAPASPAEDTCSAPSFESEPEQPTISTDEESTENLAIICLICVVGVLLGVVVCLVVCLRRQRAPEVRPYSKSRKYGSGATRSRPDKIEDW